ncbi:aldo/keto reductase [Oryzibacter oryziterrae]|uniref:aldo/keto reductase n=1 Tax=Oryzibacter oryziterrae TaxID=2766474 RepID=UPI001F394AFA|nr:aldo/keto reductase [Oryzibacter oryziterrae]
MIKRKIGKTDLAVSEYSFGCASIGGLYEACSYEDAMSVMDSAWDHGIRFFDTAPFYGFGLAERRLGDFLRQQEPDAWVISTKVGRILNPVPHDKVPDHSFVDPLPFGVTHDYSYDGIMRSVEASYNRLGLNRIDIVYVHDIGTFTHGVEGNAVHFKALMDSGLKALEQLKSEGTISAYGLGVNEVQVCVDVMKRAPIDCILLAGRYSLLDRSAEAELLPLCEEQQTSLVIGGVFNSGILATGAVPGAHFNYEPASPEVMWKVSGMEAVARSVGLTLAHPAIQFPLHHPAVASVLIGTAKVSSLTRNLDLAKIPISSHIFSLFDPYVIKRDKY